MATDPDIPRLAEQGFLAYTQVRYIRKAGLTPQWKDMPIIVKEGWCAAVEEVLRRTPMATENVQYAAVEWVGDAPRFNKYPSHTCFDTEIKNAQVRYNPASGGLVVTLELRVTGARDGDGNAIPYPSVPLEEANPDG